MEPTLNYSHLFTQLFELISHVWYKAVGILVYLIFSFHPSLSQNLVPNPYFSEIESCPVERGEVHLATPWYSPNGKTTDLVHRCSEGDYTGIPFNNWGVEFPIKGDGYAGIRTWLARPDGSTGGSSYREYLAVELLETLVAGEKYWVSFQVSVGDSAIYTSDDIGVAFSDSVIPARDVLPYTPVVRNPEDRIIYTYNGWEQISGEFVAKGGERHLVIGNFLDDAQITLVKRGTGGAIETAYFFVDEVILEPCKGRFPDNLIVNVDSSICAGEELELEAVEINDAVYAWDDGSKERLFTISQPGTYILTTEVRGCTRTDSIQIKEAATPVFDLGNDTTLCPGDRLLLEAGANSDTYEWNNGSSAPVIWIEKAGEYKVSATLGRCVFTDSIQIEYAETYIQPQSFDTLICEDTDVLLRASIEADSYVWMDNISSETLTVSEMGTFWVDIQTGCFQEREYFTVELQACGCDYFMPNVFTPNGDGINELFNPSFEPGISAFQLEIYDRWGKRMFQSSQPDFQWDGSFGGKLVAEGVYFWVLQFNCLKNGKLSRELAKGHLSLIR